MGIEAADDVSAAMVINDRRERSRPIRPVDTQANVARGPREESLLNPVDGKRLGPTGLRRCFHLLARLGWGHRLDRPEVGLGHDLKDTLDLRMKLRHDALGSPMVRRPSFYHRTARSDQGPRRRMS